MASTSAMCAHLRMSIARRCSHLLAAEADELQGFAEPMSGTMRYFVLYPLLFLFGLSSTPAACATSSSATEANDLYASAKLWRILACDRQVFALRRARSASALASLQSKALLGPMMQVGGIFWTRVFH